MFAFAWAAYDRVRVRALLGRHKRPTIMDGRPPGRRPERPMAIHKRGVCEPDAKPVL